MKQRTIQFQKHQTFFIFYLQYTNLLNRLASVKSTVCNADLKYVDSHFHTLCTLFLFPDKWFLHLRP